MLEEVGIQIFVRKRQVRLNIIIKYCYKEMKELSILRKKEEADS